MRHEWTEAELLDDLRAYLRRPFREVRRTHLRRLREQTESAAEEVAAAALRRSQRKRKLWTEIRPGRLRSIHTRLKAGDASGLSAQARRRLVLIARRPNVTTSRKWTTGKASRVTVNEDQLRFHFHHWAASVARGASKLKGRIAADQAAAERVRQNEFLYQSLDSAIEREDEEEQALEQTTEATRRAALQRLVDHGRALREDARLEALEAKELEDVPEGPWIALDAARPPILRVLEGLDSE